MAAAVAYSMRHTPPDNLLDELSTRRPGWYRLLNGLIATVMTAATAVLSLLWHWNAWSGWWVPLGLATTASYAWGLRPGRRRR
ncbi:hypothetical protein [Actinoplanes sp. NPDC049316]|uniref:hypothetical protein n=1 Tax=Actinoplanes sp. NPDC049316 TaxID=3154727 RepID=UPI0034296687